MAWHRLRVKVWDQLWVQAVAAFLTGGAAWGQSSASALGNHLMTPVGITPYPHEGITSAPRITSVLLGKHSGSILWPPSPPGTPLQGGPHSPLCARGVLPVAPAEDKTDSPGDGEKEEAGGQHHPDQYRILLQGGVCQERAQRAGV